MFRDLGLGLGHVGVCRIIGENEIEKGKWHGNCW